MRLAVDAWAPDFGTAMTSPGDMQPAPGPVDLGREVDVQDWAPRTVGDAVAPIRDVRFVDGVRRIDARIWAVDGPSSRPAIAVSYAAGTVRSNGHAVIEELEVRRELFGPAGMPALECGSVTYHPVAVAGDSDDDLIGAVQKRMGRLEIAVAERGETSTVLIVDGPLSGRQHVRGAVGYVKTHRTAYLPPVLDGVVAALEPGQRTPLFVMESSWTRYSWYLRLPHGEGHPWAGVVRLEAPADLELDAVIHLADQTAVTLPRFASQPHRDPRAPQNLYPIAGLEQQLKRRLGDRAHLERVLRRAAAATTAA